MENKVFFVNSFLLIIFFLTPINAQESDRLIDVRKLIKVFHFCYNYYCNFLNLKNIFIGNIRCYKIISHSAYAPIKYFTNDAQC